VPDAIALPEGSRLAGDERLVCIAHAPTTSNGARRRTTDVMYGIVAENILRWLSCLVDGSFWNFFVGKQ
jgi:hypothetical protein